MRFTPISVRAQLLFAFFGIGSLAVLAAGSSIYAFFQLRNTMTEVTEQRAPIAIEALTLSRQTEAIVAAAPQLLQETADNQNNKSQEIRSKVDQLTELLSSIEKKDIDHDVLDSIKSTVQRVRGNLADLDAAIHQLNITRSHIQDRRINFKAVLIQLQRLLHPALVVIESNTMQIKQALPQQQHNVRLVKLVSELVALQPVQKIMLASESISASLSQLMMDPDIREADVVIFPLKRNLLIIDDNILQLENPLGQELKKHLQEMTPFVSGPHSIPVLRKQELEFVLQAKNLLKENVSLSRVLTRTVDQLVSSAKTDIDIAVAETSSIQRLGNRLLIGIVSLILVSSGLVVWLLIDRNLIRRIHHLSTSMHAIADGDLDLSLPPGGDDELGQMEKALIQFQDTSRRAKQSNLDELEQIKQRFNDAMESISDGFLLFDADDQLVISNSHLQKMFSIKASFLNQKNLSFRNYLEEVAFQLGADRNHPGYEKWLQLRVDRHHNPSGSFIMPLRDGRWLRVNERRTHDGGIVGVISDITTVKHRESQLMALLDGLDYGILFVDTESRIQMANRKYRELWELEESFINGKPTLHELMSASQQHDDYKKLGLDWSTYVTNRIEAIQNGNASPSELHQASGRVLLFQSFVLPEGMRMATYFDITPMKQVEESLRQSKELAEQANRAKSQFLANMSHELRTPLNAVIGITEMLIEDEIDDLDIKEPLQRISRAGYHLLHLINEILDLAKIEAGHVELEYENINLSTLLDEVTRLSAPLAKINNNQFKLDISADIAVISIDPVRLQQILLNILGNAFKFTYDGEVLLKAYKQSRNGSNTIVFEVTDTGIGIDSENIETLFGEFTQADESTTRQYGGTGLGLAISQRLCQMMKGKISVDSTPEMGSTFRVCLPI